MSKMPEMKRPLGILMAAFIVNSEISDEELDNSCIAETMQVNDITPCNKYQRLCHSSLASRLKEEGWEPIIEQNSFYVLRRSVNCYCYEYKVFGTFQDIPPRIFYDVQLDTEYRKQWDSLVVKLEVIDQTDNGTEVIHWVMHYPFPMCKREYVFLRKSKIDQDNNVMVLVNKAVDHPDMPQQNNFVRVRDYYSKMVIKPHRGLDDMGFDYILTYYDDPQAPFPSTAYNWMACYGVPDFVVKLHKAALDLYNSKKLQPSQNVLTSSGSSQYAYA